MAWWRDAVWQEGISIVLVVAGSVLIYLGAAETAELAGVAAWGAALFGLGVLLPIIAELRRARRDRKPEAGDLD